MIRKAKSGENGTYYFRTIMSILWLPLTIIFHVIPSPADAFFMYAPGGLLKNL